MLRHARRMRADPMGFLAGPASALGDVVQFPVPGRPVLFVNDPAAVQRVLRDNHRAYGKRTVQYDGLSLVTGEGLLTSDLETWRDRRRVQQPAFSHGSLEPLVGIVAAAADRLAVRWGAAPTGSLVDVDRAMDEVALEVVGRGLLSADLDPRANGLVDAVVAALAQVVAEARTPVPLPTAVPTPGRRRLRAARARIDAAVAELLAVRRDGPPLPDLLGLLLTSDLDEEQVRDEVVTMLVAGHETVAAALTWSWSLLGAHEDAASRLWAEVDDVLGSGASAGPPTWSDVARLAWTRQVVDETLRMYPPAWVITRRALEDDVLAGVAVPAGSLVIVGTHALHHRADVWPEPDRFEPARFADLVPPQRQAYVPFGSGPRLCIGRDFALLEAVVVLARLSQAFRLRPASRRPPRPDALVTVRPAGGLLMRLEHRT